MSRRRGLTRLLAAAGIVLGAACGRTAPELVLATTTSTQDTGLLDSLLPPFTSRTGIDVKVIAVGTGAALEMARRGGRRGRAARGAPGRGANRAVRLAR